MKTIRGISMKGKVWKFGDDIDTDIILPGRYLIYTDEETLSNHCMEGLDSDFKGKINDGDFIVAGKNFGCGSSREHAPIAIKGCGIGAVIAESALYESDVYEMGLYVLEDTMLFQCSTETFLHMLRAKRDIAYKTLRAYAARIMYNIHTSD